MVRATYARTLVRLGGTPPPSWTEAAITALCTQADYLIDGYSYPQTIPTTSNTAIELAVDVVLRLMRQSDMMHQSSGSTSGDSRTYPEFEPLSADIKDRIDRLLISADLGCVVVDMIAED